MLHLNVRLLAHSPMTNYRCVVLGVVLLINDVLGSSVIEECSC